ncbi:MAG: hypothetical protein CBD02_04595 [Candidatus Pelagibacter sp. TMED142]|nr:MAG: hypothetical protein CBD02_04595 [Candidatus Pelagibacter sp. TMED142]
MAKGGSDNRDTRNIQETITTDNRQDNSINIDDFTDDDSVTIGNVDASDRSITDNSDRSVQVIDASDRSIQDYSTSFEQTDNRVFNTVTDGGAIKGNIDIARGGLDLAGDISNLGFAFASDAQDSSFEAITSVLRETANADAKGDAAMASTFSALVDSTRSEGAKALDNLIMVVGVVGALAFLTRS